MNKGMIKKTNLNGKKSKCKMKAISYRLNCAKTANGLSHYVMYGDADKKKALL